MNIQNINYETLRYSVMSKQLIYHGCNTLSVLSKDIKELTYYLQTIYEPCKIIVLSINRLIFIHI